MEPWISSRALTRLWGLWLIAAAGIVWLANKTHVDIALADSMFDFHLHAFPFKHDFWMETVVHQYAKLLLTALWVVILLIAVLPTKIVTAYVSDHNRHALRWVAGLAVLNAVTISWLKHQMPHACPWDITRYGGTTPWVPAFTSHPAMQAGHCFPAGHASSGLWMSALCLLWLPQAPRQALLVAIGGLSVGFLLGWAQQLRGAHFLSHTLTSAWLMCGWLLIAVTFFKSRH